MRKLAIALMLALFAAASTIGTVSVSSPAFAQAKKDDKAKDKAAAKKDAKKDKAAKDDGKKDKAKAKSKGKAKAKAKGKGKGKAKGKRAAPGKCGPYKYYDKKTKKCADATEPKKKS
jgi:uncharacterized low-complexity protein